MGSPKVVKCSDGHFRCAIFSLGPYIADYPEQVWLAGIVQDWCPKHVLASSRNVLLLIIFGRCDAKPDNLDAPCSHRRTHEKTDFLIKNFDPGILWDEYGIRGDIVVCYFFLWLQLHSDHAL
jgi:Plavaka transposase